MVKRTKFWKPNKGKGYRVHGAPGWTVKTKRGKPLGLVKMGRPKGKIRKR